MLRGWAILLVVIGHSIQWTVPNFDAYLAFRLIYSFHMPLFFFISGVVGARSIRRPLLRQLRDRTLGLLVPFISWYVLVSTASWLLGGSPLPRTMLNLYQSPDRGLWFLWVLFVIGMGSAVLLRVAPEKYAWAALLIAAAALQLVHVPVLGEGLVKWYFPFFAAGLVLAPRFIRGTALMPPKTWLPDALAIVVFIILATGWRRAELIPVTRLWARIGMPLPSMVELSYRYACASFGIAASVVLVRRIPRGVWSFDALRYLGISTLEIYVSHQLFLSIFAGIGILWVPVVAAIALVGSLALANVLKRVMPLRVLLYGGRS